MKVDPFTRTPGIAGKAYINTHCAERIIQDFENEESSKYIYKIVGLRGSGKSVEYSQLLNHFRNSNNWLVYGLSVAGNPLEVLIAKLSQENFVDSKKRVVTKNSDIAANSSLKFLGLNGALGVSTTTEENEHFYSGEATLALMIKKAEKKNLNILVGIDDIARTV